MKKTISILGAVGLFIASLGNVMSFTINKDNFKQNQSSVLANIKKESCGCSNSITTYKEEHFEDANWKITTLTLDQWLINTLFSSFKVNEELTYKDVYRFLTGSASNFAEGTNENAKEIIAKAIISQGFEYANKQIAGIFVRVVENQLGENWEIDNVDVGVFDSTKSQPLQQEIDREIKFNKAFNVQEIFNDREFATDGLMSYHFQKRYVNDISRIPYTFKYVAFPDAKLRAWYGDLNGEIYDEWNYSEMINGLHPKYETANMYKDNADSWILETEFEKTFTSSKNPQSSLVFDTSNKINIIFKENEEFKDQYDIYLKNKHVFKNYSPVQNGNPYMTIDYKINDKIAFYNSYDKSEIEKVYNEKSSNRSVNTYQIPPENGSPFLSRLLYDQILETGEFGVLIYLNHEALHTFQNLICTEHWSSNSSSFGLQIIRQLLLIILPEFSSYSFENQIDIVTWANLAILNRYDESPNYLHSFLNEFVDNQLATFGATIIATNFNTESIEDVKFVVRNWNTPPENIFAI
ncbi:hypothetical protein CXP39_00755 [Mesoplasma syrphidae]|uniref:Uncharacterized protein n=1 Tax=Mesoplasma syrphidae TaxID=225999 RepID=A0A2K9C1I7_9MOLU|nr:hypothetical protein [Mesoplasma syrphidae]AUF83339.1 hypothetical protein CXP39_00755 [Mesoplasma syrphidae]